MTAAPFIVLSQSAHELVVWKRAGLATELPIRGGLARPPSSGRARRASPHCASPARLLPADSLQSLVASMYLGATPKLPHRLDRVTSGIVVVALSDEAIAFHNAEIKARRWEKYYLARVAATKGTVPEALVGVHKAFLTTSAGRAKIVSAGGKPAWLEIIMVAPAPGRPDRWQLLIRLLTGRFHQIRVMCAALGLPLAGDPLYDPDARDPREFSLEHIMLKFTSFDARTRTTVFLPQLDERDPVAPSIAARLAELAAVPS